MKTNPNRFWWTVIALGWAFDFFFWNKAPGINFVVYVSLCVAAGILLLRAAGQRAHRNTIFLLPLLVAFAVIIFVRKEPMTVFLSVGMVLFLMGLFAISFMGGRWSKYNLVDQLKGFLQLIGSMIARPLGFSAEIKRKQAEAGQRSASQVWSVVRGIFIALPIVAIFAALLGSADLVFGERLEEFIELFNLEDLPEYIFRLILILGVANAIAGAYLHAATERVEEKLVGENKPLIASFLGFTEAAIVLGSVGLLFSAFVSVQSQYFFGGQTNIQIDGYTYSEYARRGFGELVTVAIFSLLLILIAGAVTRRETESQRRVFSGLSVGIVSLVLVMLFSAFQRLVLYETVFGFTRLRTYTHVFMIWLAVLLVVGVALEIYRLEHKFAFAALLVSFGFVLSLGLMNVDGFIVRKNVSRAIQGQDFDVSYLARLSSDAVPALAVAFQNKALPASVNDGLGAALACHMFYVDQASDLPWQSFHLSQETSARILKTIELDLESYRGDSGDWGYQVITPLGKDHHCAYRD